MKPVRFGLVGCGGIVRALHAPVLAKTRGCEVVALADASREACEALRGLLPRKDKIAVHTDHRRMFREGGLDAAFVTTPHTLHHGHVRDALRSGLHVICEKPLACEARHARDLLALARRRGKILMASYQRHHSPAYRLLREWVRAGDLGSITAVAGTVSQDWHKTDPKAWRWDPGLSGGGMLMDSGSHLLASMFWVTGLVPISVSGVVETLGHRVDVNSVAQFRFRGGAVGSLTVVGNSPTHEESLAIWGTKGTCTLIQRHWKLEALTRDGRSQPLPPALPRLDRRYPVEDFVEWVRAGKGFEYPDYTIHVARLTQGIYRSAREGGRTVRL